jgi:hypothetical protein
MCPRLFSSLSKTQITQARSEERSCHQRTTPFLTLRVHLLAFTQFASIWLYDDREPLLSSPTLNLTHARRQNLAHFSHYSKIGCGHCPSKKKVPPKKRNPNFFSPKRLFPLEFSHPPVVSSCRRLPDELNLPVDLCSWLALAGHYVRIVGSMISQIKTYTGVKVVLAIRGGERMIKRFRHLSELGRGNDEDCQTYITVRRSNVEGANGNYQTEPTPEEFTIAYLMLANGSLLLES